LSPILHSITESSLFCGELEKYYQAYLAGIGDELIQNAECVHVGRASVRYNMLRVRSSLYTIQYSSLSYVICNACSSQPLDIPTSRISNAFWLLWAFARLVPVMMPNAKACSYSIRRSSKSGDAAQLEVRLDQRIRSSIGYHISSPSHLIMHVPCTLLESGVRPVLSTILQCSVRDFTLEPGRARVLKLYGMLIKWNIVLSIPVTSICCRDVLRHCICEYYRLRTSYVALQ
jgi:hypothetical protein